MTIAVLHHYVFEYPEVLIDLVQAVYLDLKVIIFDIVKARMLTLLNLVLGHVSVQKRKTSATALKVAMMAVRH